MPEVLITFDPDDMRRYHRFFRHLPEMATEAENKALNRAASFGQTLIAKAIGKHIGAKETAVKRRVLKFNSKKDNLSAELVVKGKGVNFADYDNAHQTAEGVEFGGEGDLAVSRVPHAFIAKGLHGNLLAFIDDNEREKVAPTHGRYAGRRIVSGPHKGELLLRRPLKSETGPEVSTIFEQTPGMESEAEKEIVNHLHHDVTTSINKIFGEVTT